MNRSIVIPIDDEILFALKKDLRDVSKDTRAFIATQYFKERRLGLGLGARMAGMTKDEFTTHLGRNDIDIYQYTDEELQTEFDLVDEIAGGLS